MWRLLKEAIPVNDNIQRRGISFISKCSCCSNFRQETMGPLFLHSELAQGLWGFFDDQLHTNIQAPTVVQFIRRWLHWSRQRSQFGHIVYQFSGNYRRLAVQRDLTIRNVIYSSFLREFGIICVMLNRGINPKLKTS